MSVSTTICNLSASLWLELICKPQLEFIEDYIRLIQTCRFFWSDNPVFQERRKELERRVFGIYGKNHWNKLRVPLEGDPMVKHGFFLHYEHIDLFGSTLLQVGVFSSKERLWIAFTKIINLKTLELNSKSTFSYTPCQICVSVINENSREFVCVSRAIWKEFVTN